MHHYTHNYDTQHALEITHYKTLKLKLKFGTKMGKFTLSDCICMRWLIKDSNLVTCDKEVPVLNIKVRLSRGNDLFIGYFLVY